MKPTRKRKIQLSKRDTKKHSHFKVKRLQKSKKLKLKLKLKKRGGTNGQSEDATLLKELGLINNDVIPDNIKKILDEPVTDDEQPYKPVLELQIIKPTRLIYEKNEIIKEILFKKGIINEKEIGNLNNLSQKGTPNKSVEVKIKEALINKGIVLTDTIKNNDLYELARVNLLDSLPTPDDLTKLVQSKLQSQEKKPYTIFKVNKDILVEMKKEEKELKGSEETLKTTSFFDFPFKSTISQLITNHHSRINKLKPKYDSIMNELMRVTTNK